MTPEAKTPFELEAVHNNVCIVAQSDENELRANIPETTERVGVYNF